MSAPYSSLLLDNDNNDLCADAMGNIALAQPPYAVAQDVATAIKTFLGDCIYDVTLGVDYFGQLLGHVAPASLLKQRMIQAALGYPQGFIVKASVTLQSVANRQVTGFVSFTDANGLSQGVQL
jgi:hypothetical protein